MVEQVEDRRGHGLAGVGQEDADLPNLSIAELGFEGRHAGEANAVFDFPIGLAGRIVTDADDAGIVAVGLEQLGSVGEHVVADRSRSAVEAVADGTAFNVDASAGGQVSLIGLHVGADHILLDAGIERQADELTFVGKRGIGDGDGHSSIAEVSQHGEGNEDNAENESDQESTHERVMASVALIVLHAGGDSGKIRRGASKG